MLKPLRSPEFFRFRGRVIRGIPAISSLPYAARIPSANAAYSAPMSSTVTRQVPYESSALKPGIPKKCRWKSSRRIARC